jgi:PIN domain nuclease of toxin-antitoxin system
MKILIDTQVFVWLVGQDPRLGQDALEMLSDTSNRVFISYFSFFEMKIKESIGKMTIDIAVVDDLPTMGIELLDSDINALRSYSIFNPDNKDPFDNILISIALSERCSLMTSDSKILATKLNDLKLINALK